MAVAFPSTFSVKPDRLADWLEPARMSKPAWEKAGGKNIRVLAGLVAGQATGSRVWIVEADDFAAGGDAPINRGSASPRCPART
jgi:hypothetical protein